MARTKRRDNASTPFEFKRAHLLIGAVVVVATAGIAILIVTLLGGSSLSDERVTNNVRRVTLPTPVGAELPAERSPAADLLAGKTWDDMTPEERALVRNETNRVFNDATFRASSKLIVGIDIYRRNGNTQVSRQWNGLKTDSGPEPLVESLIFYCSAADNSVIAYKYFKRPDRTELSQAKGQHGLIPWDPIMVSLNWSDVKDIGFKTVNGHKTHGFELPFGVPTADNSAASIKTRYWFDIDTGRLMERDEAQSDGTIDESLGYILDWRQFGPISIPEDQPKPQCVTDLADALNK